MNRESLGGVTLSANGSTVGLSSVLSSDNQLLTITPVAGLLPNTTYMLTVNGVADLAGNAMTTPTTSRFTTSGGPDLTNPTVVSVSPVNNATGILTTASFQMQFSKMIDELSAGSQDVKLTTNGTTFINTVITFNQSGTVMTITTVSPLSTSTTYLLQLTNAILDLEGMTVAAFQSSFTTSAN